MSFGRAKLAVAAALATVLVPMGARAGNLWHTGPTLVDKPTAYVEALAAADRYAIAAAERSRINNTLQAWRYARLAVAAYDKAIRANPKSPEPHLRAAVVIYSHWFLGDPLRCLSKKQLCLEAIDHWHAFEKLAPLDPRINEYLFQRALLYTTLYKPRYLKKAIADYTRLINSTQFASMGRDRSTTMGNLAEVYMMLGDLDKAIPMYMRAVAEGNMPLHAYGLAVALDRDGRGEKAREIMRKFGSGDVDRRTGLLRSLDPQKGVFFVPKGEINYYHALGFDALGQPAMAIVYYQRFLRSGAHPRFAPRARENIKRLRKKVMQQLKKTRPPGILTPVVPSN